MFGFPFIVSPIRNSVTGCLADSGYNKGRGNWADDAFTPTNCREPRILTSVTLQTNHPALPPIIRPGSMINRIDRPCRDETSFMKAAAMDPYCIRSN